MSGPKFLVLAPTRELALQIEMELRKYAPMSVTSLIGVRRDADRATLSGTASDRRWWWSVRRGGCSILAGSGHLHLGGVTFLVMDEADQMLDRGFLRDIQRIIRLLPRERQTLLFSATFSGEIQTLAQSMQRDPARISVDPGISTPTTIVACLLCRAG